MGIQERRRFSRVPANLKISYKTASNCKDDISVTEDISQGGVRFFVNEFIPKKTVLELRLALKNSDLFIETSAVVKWITAKTHSKRFEVGVEFVNISEKAMGYLIDYISQNLDA